jgi:natural product biosynthesis luciferase-like monooxygenase protein
MDAIQLAHSNRHQEPPTERRFNLSLMFFGDNESDPLGDKYRLLIESSRFADQHGFQGLWLPERHFTRFGCLYPAPAVIHAAIARETRSLRLRAGSVVMPLNDPVRIAEQWAVVDNLSDGRVEIAFASGWHPDDFALMPDAYRDRNERMLRGITEVESLWRGDTIERVNGAGETIAIRTYPTPIQRDLPAWLTAASNPETFRLAGQLGYGVLTHLFHHDVESLKEKIAIYRAARKLAGHHDPQGQVAVTLHAFVADSLDAVRRDAGEAYCRYLKSNLGLLKHLAFSHGQSMQIETLPKAELDQLLGWMLDKFIGGRSLMGTIDSCTATCEELARIGVSEVACLLDFGPNTADILNKNLPALAQLREHVAKLRILATDSQRGSLAAAH